MCFMDLEKAKIKFNSEMMKENIKRLIEFDEFHCLLKGSMSRAMKAQECLGYIPKQYSDWLKLCDGGLLFDTILLSSKGHCDDLDLDFDSYEDYNNDASKSEFNLPEEYSIIAVRSYGEPICLKNEKGNNRVYLWDSERQEFVSIWDSFEDWMAEEIDTAIELIAEDAMDPLPIKLGGADHD